MSVQNATMANYSSSFIWLHHKFIVMQWHKNNPIDNRKQFFLDAKSKI